MSTIVVGASSITGFNANNIGADTNLSGVSVTLDSPTVTGSNILRAQWVGMGGFKVQLNGVEYTVASVESRSSFTLTENYAGTTGTVTGIWRKYAVLRVYVMQPFVPSGESYVAQSGAPDSTVWFRRYAVPVINDGDQNIAYIPQIDLPATTNSSVPTARYFAGLYTPSGSFIQSFPGCVDEWRLDADTTPTSWAQICAFNSPTNPAPPEPINYYTAREIDARFPSGLADQLLYFEETGNVLSPLTLGPDLQITAGVLEFAGPGGINRLQEEGSNLPQQTTLNFVGSAFTAADDPGNDRTNLSADSDLNAIASNSTNGIYARTGSGTVAARTITGPAAGITVSNGDGVAGNPTLALANNLAALEAINTTGLIAQTGADTVTPRTITGPAAGITVTDGNGVSGNPTLALANDLAAVEGLSTNGIAVRTATSTWTTRTITATANQTTVSNGDGVSGNPTIGTVQDIGTASSPTFATPTVTGLNVGASGIARSGANPVDLISNGLTVARVQSNGTLQVLSGNGSTSYKRAAGTYFSDITTRNNSGTAETVLSTKTLDANTLGTAGDAIIAEFDVAIQAASSGSNFFRVYFGGTSSGTGGTQLFQSTVANTGLLFRVTIWRISADTVLYSWSANYDSSSTHGRGSVGSLSFTGNLVLESRGISTADGSNEVTNNATLMYKFDNP